MNWDLKYAFKVSPFIGITPKAPSSVLIQNNKSQLRKDIEGDKFLKFIPQIVDFAIQ